MDILDKSRREKWTDWLIESVLICASILLAFWLDDWGEERQIKQRTQVALCNIKQELQDNFTTLTTDYRPRHRGLLDYVQKTVAQLRTNPAPTEAIPLIDRPLFLSALDNTAWQLALETGYLLHADFPFAAEIARVYRIQEDSFKQNFPHIIDVLFAQKTGTGVATLESQITLRTLFTELLAQEDYLINRYQKLLQSDGMSEMHCLAATD